MRYLFIHQNFPGQFLHILRRLAAEGCHDIVFLTGPNENRMHGVRKVVYPYHPGTPSLAHPGAKDLDMALRRADAVASACKELRGLGFVPDIVVGHHGWGEMLSVQDVWPGVPMYGYFEFYYHPTGADVGFDPEFESGEDRQHIVRARNAINHLALTLPGHGQSPTEWQRSTYPDWAQPKIDLLREGIDLAKCTPDPKVRQTPFALAGRQWDLATPLVTYLARGLEPYRGFHIFMRSLVPLFKERPDAHVVIVGNDAASYGPSLLGRTWKEHMLQELAGKIPLDHVHFVGLLHNDDHLRLFQRSDAHVYLTYPFVASWSLREALGCGCAMVAGDTPTVTEFVQDGINGRIVPTLDPNRVAQGVLEVLHDRHFAGTIRHGARAYAQANLAMDAYLDTYQRRLQDLAYKG